MFLSIPPAWEDPTRFLGSVDLKRTIASKQEGLDPWRWSQHWSPWEAPRQTLFLILPKFLLLRCVEGAFEDL